MPDTIPVLYVRGEAGGADLGPHVLERECEPLKVTVKSTGEAGIAGLSNSDCPFDCVVSRHRLPDMDGVEFVEEVRERFPHLPVLLRTTDGDEAVASAAIRAGVSDYIPEDNVSDPIEELAERIEESVARYRSIEAAQRSHRQLQELTERTKDCLWIFDQDWEELHFVSGYEEVWNRPVEAVQEDPQDFLNGVHPDDRSQFEEAMDTLSGGESIDIEYRILKRDEETGWVWVKGEPVFEDGEVVRVVGFTRDITERRERERRYRTLVENLPGMVYRSEIDLDWTVDFVHGECKELTGYTAEELVEDIDYGSDIIHPDDRTDVYESIERALEETDSFEITYRIQHRDGDTRWVWERGREVDSGKIEGFIRDITERVEHEEKLELRNQALEDAPVGIVITDPSQTDNPIIYANDKFSELTGYSSDQTVGRNCRFLQGPDTGEDPVAALREAVDTAEPATVELRNYRKDGSMFWNRVSIAPVLDEAGSVSNYIGFQEDVTNRRQRQQQLTVLGRVLRHNLRNDVNVVRGWAEEIERGTDPPLSEFAQHIVDKSDELMSVAEKEREITEILTGEPSPTQWNLTETIERAVNPLQEEYPGAKISVKCPGTVMVEAAEGIGEAISELLHNAIIHDDSETVSVTISVTVEDDSVTLTVADEGPEIPAMERNVLTESKAETSVFHGSGLGLWLVNLVVTRSNGSVTYESADPRGNIISISLSKSG